MKTCIGLDDEKLSEDTFTLTVFGMGRSGTTMVARCLLALGLDMGRHLTPKTCEDAQIRNAIKLNDMDKFMSYCLKRNAESEIWGFKVPAFRDKIDDFLPKLRNPRVVVTFRDPVAIALRLYTNHDYQKSDFPKLLDRAARKTAQLTGSVSRLNCPVLLISYEKSLAYPEELVRALARFACARPSDEQVKLVARQNVINGDPRYTSSAMA